MGFVADLFGGGQEDAANAGAAAQVRAAREAIASQERSATQAINASRQASERGLGFLDQFSGIGERGIEASSFLANPEEQFNFLKSNPIFELAMQNANRETNARAASKGRLSAGDTLSQLSNNVLLSARPLINDQRTDINNMLNLGFSNAQSQANTSIGQGTNVANILQNTGNNVADLQAQIGNAQSAGTIAAQNADTQGANNVLSLAGGLFGGGGFSDSRLKQDAEITGIDESGYDLWKWKWNKKAKELFNLDGDGFGVMFSDVLKRNPDAVSYQNGYGKVNYEMIGVQHGT
tara:strand:- start:5505 stop:6383 length:879 start_codon:yes stop_codon:yes gene_type:complete